MSNALVSIIIPCYNHENFVQDCIKSIIDQDYPNIELIIIDDGSKDNSVSKIEELIPLCEERFTRFEFRHRPNQGLCNTLNEGLEWVQGEYLCSVASDDIWLKEKTTVQVNYLNEHPETVAVFGNMYLIDENNHIIKKYSEPFKRYSFKDIFLHRYYTPTASNMARTAAIKKIGGYPPHLIIEDWYMWLKLAELEGYLDTLPTTLAHYRKHNTNYSANEELMHRGKLQIVNLYKGHELYSKALQRVYKGTLNDLQKFNLSIFKEAICTCPSLIYSSVFWRKSMLLLRKNKK